MASQKRYLAAGFVAVLLLVSAKCDVQSFRQHKEAQKKTKLMLDPSAVYKYFEKDGDITWVKPEFDEKYGHPKRSKRLTKTTTVLWEGGHIPYTIDQSYTGHDRNVILSALSHYEEKTCLRFKERTDETDYLRFFRGAGCQSFVGKQSYQPQGVSLSSGCLREFNLVLHEIGHAIGLLHEHTRPDRDNYVDILYDNIYRGFKDQFEINDPDLLNTLGVGYDYNSIMHYKPGAFGNTSTPGITIVASNPGIPIGPGVELSKLDTLKINILYQCKDDPPPRYTIYVPPSGFLQLPPLTAACGKRFDGFMNGVITSPDFPNYSANQDCQWQIRVPTGFQIRFDFTDVNLHQSPGCQENRIEIYDNPDCTGYLVTKLCNAPKYSFYSFGNVACVRYHSGDPSNSQDLTGFRMTFSADDEDECYFPGICEHKCVNTPGGYHCTCPEGYFLSADGSSCFDVNECAMGGHMCEHKCENYGGHHECVCPDGSLQVGNSCAHDVNECLTENGGCDHLCTNTEESYFCTCREGFLLQADGHSCTPLLTTTPVPTMQTTTIQATTVPTTQATTKQATTVVPTSHPTSTPSCPPVTLPKLPDCNTILRDNTGTLSSPNWPLTYNNNQVCDWLIILQDCTKKIRIEFQGFSVAGKMPDCSKDQVYVRAGLKGTEDPVGLLCHLTIPDPIVIDSHTARITMVSGPKHGKIRLGFTATYRAVDG